MLYLLYLLYYQKKSGSFSSFYTPKLLNVSFSLCVSIVCRLQQNHQVKQINLPTHSHSNSHSNSQSHHHGCLQLPLPPPNLLRPLRSIFSVSQYLRALLMIQMPENILIREIIVTFQGVDSTYFHYEFFLSLFRCDSSAKPPSATSS